jgi:hypothetical protein
MRGMAATVPQKASKEEGGAPARRFPLSELAARTSGERGGYDGACDQAVSPFPHARARALLIQQIENQGPKVAGEGPGRSAYAGGHPPCSARRGGRLTSQHETPLVYAWLRLSVYVFLACVSMIFWLRGLRALGAVPWVLLCLGSAA